MLILQETLPKGHDLKGVQERWPPNPVPGSRAAQQAGGNQGSDGCRSFFQQAAPGAGLMLSHDFKLRLILMESGLIDTSFQGEFSKDGMAEL